MVMRDKDLDLNIVCYFTCLPYLNIGTMKGAGNATTSSSHVMLGKGVNA